VGPSCPSSSDTRKAEHPSPKAVLKKVPKMGGPEVSQCVPARPTPPKYAAVKPGTEHLEKARLLDTINVACFSLCCNIVFEITGIHVSSESENEDLGPEGAPSVVGEVERVCFLSVSILLYLRLLLNGENTSRKKSSRRQAAALFREIRLRIQAKSLPFLLCVQMRFPDLYALYMNFVF